MRFISPLFSDARGSMGGLTATKGAAAGFLRAKVAPLQSATHAQQLRRTQQATIASAWRALTQTQRVGWQLWATANPTRNSLGQLHALSGFQWFVSCNRNLLLAGLATVAKAPVSAPKFPALTQLVVVASVTSNRVHVLAITSATSTIALRTETLISASAPLSPGITANLQRSLRYIPPPYFNYSTGIEFGAAYNLIFPTIHVGQQIKLSAAPFDSRTGLLGVPVFISTIAVMA